MVITLWLYESIHILKKYTELFRGKCNNGYNLPSNSTGKNIYMREDKQIDKMRARKIG